MRKLQLQEDYVQSVVYKALAGRHLVRIYFGEYTHIRGRGTARKLTIQWGDYKHTNHVSTILLVLEEYCYIVSSSIQLMHYSSPDFESNLTEMLQFLADNSTARL